MHSAVLHGSTLERLLGPDYVLVHSVIAIRPVQELRDQVKYRWGTRESGDAE